MFAGKTVKLCWQLCCHAWAPGEVLDHDEALYESTFTFTPSTPCLHVQKWSVHCRPCPKEEAKAALVLVLSQTCNSPTQCHYSSVVCDSAQCWWENLYGNLYLKPFVGRICNWIWTHLLCRWGSVCYSVVCINKLSAMHWESDGVDIKTEHVSGAGAEN